MIARRAAAAVVDLCTGRRPEFKGQLDHGTPAARPSREFKAARPAALDDGHAELRHRRHLGPRLAWSLSPRRTGPEQQACLARSGSGLRDLSSALDIPAAAFNLRSAAQESPSDPRLRSAKVCCRIRSRCPRCLELTKQTLGERHGSAAAIPMPKGNMAVSASRTAHEVATSRSDHHDVSAPAPPAGFVPYGELRRR
eukprot:SAG31_NODE_10142_length_1178_cov_1.779425_2_plen_196_part_01